MPTSLGFVTVSGTPAFILNGDVPLKVDKVFGATLLSQHKRWVFPAFRPVHRRVLEDLRRVCPSIELLGAAEAHRAAMDVPAELPPGYEFVTSPFKHQHEGLQWTLDNPRSGLFFSPGLGKCKITVDLYRATLKPMLIFCPAVVLDTWAAEFITHGRIPNTIIIDGSPKQKLARIEEAQKSPPAAVIVTYETASRYTGEISKIAYETVMADESHRMKNITSVRTKGALILSERASRRHLLSGTPTLGSPFSLYSQFRFLGRCFAPESWIDYKKEYGEFPIEELRSGKPVRVIGYKNMDMLNTRVNEICLRRTQEECLDLPPQRIIDVEFDVSPEQRRAYNHLVEEKSDVRGMGVRHAMFDGELTHALGTTLEDYYVWAEEPVSLLNKLEQVTGGFLNQTKNNPGICNGCPELETCLARGIRPFTNRCSVVQKPDLRPLRYKDNARADACKDLLEDLLEDPTNKIIIWTRYLAELEIVEELAKELGVGYVTVQGGMTRQAFKQARDDFNEKPEIRLYIGQVASGIGVTLNAANYMIYYSMPWSHEHYVQSIARNYRIGQLRCVTVYRLLAKFTMDIAKAAALDQKIEIEDALTSSDYEPTCLLHSPRPVVGSKCTCDGNIMRIVAKLKVIP